MRRPAFLRDWYPGACAGLIIAWLCAWFLSFHNIYGWLTDDINTFARVLQYESGGKNLIDIAWFHAYNWFIVALPWLFHWSIPSHMIPQAWEHTGEFRAFIFYIIVLHAVILALIAYLLVILCANRLVALGALALFMTSPTFVFYSDLLDSRYLGLLAGIPALFLLLRAYPRVDQRRPLIAALASFFLPGFLIGLGQSIHYTLTYFAGPVALVYWLYALGGRWTSLTVWKNLTWFVAGLLLWFVPVQALSLMFHPFKDSMVGILYGQIELLKSTYDKLSDLATWVHLFLEDMGLPMIVLVLSGAVIVYRDDLRPKYISRFHGRLMFWSCVIAVAYLLVTPSVAFYRQLAMYQIFFMLFCIIAIDTLSLLFLRFGKLLRGAVVAVLLVLAAWVPSVARMPAVFVDAQGLGRAVNTAHALAGTKGRVYFIEFYDYDVYPLSIVSRQDFDYLRPGDFIVTDFPTIFFGKYPDIFALLHDTGPVASYPTEWCTVENWVEERTYWNFRRYQDEPESCNAQVYSVAAIRATSAGKPLNVKSLTADSTLTSDYEPQWVFDRRVAQIPTDLTDCCNAIPLFHEVWASNGSTRRHWFEVHFKGEYPLNAVTVVPVNYFTPPAFNTVGRPQFVSLYGIDARGIRHFLWKSRDLRDVAIFTARFPRTTLAGIRLEIQQPPADDQRHAIMFYQRLSPSPVAGIEYIRFPGYSVHY